MTVETLPTFPSAAETAKTTARSMMPRDFGRASGQRLVFPEPEPQQAPPVRWPRVFPSLEPVTVTIIHAVPLS